MVTGFVWHERYAWHDARGLVDVFDRGALFEPEPSLESGISKRRLRNLVDASRARTMGSRPASPAPISTTSRASSSIRVTGVASWEDGFQTCKPGSHVDGTHCVLLRAGQRVVSWEDGFQT